MREADDMSEFGDEWDDLAENATNRYAGDKGLTPRFYYVASQDQEMTEQEGRPIYKDKLFIEIRLPGNKDEVRQSKGAAYGYGETHD